MDEEEKKAIEYIKRHIIPYYGNKGRIEFMLNDIILNLIKKQQKEIDKQNKLIDEMKKLERMLMYDKYEDTYRDVICAEELDKILKELEAEDE